MPSIVLGETDRHSLIHMKFRVQRQRQATKKKYLIINYTECYEVKTKQKTQGIVTRKIEGIFQKVIFEM